MSSSPRDRVVASAPLLVRTRLRVRTSVNRFALHAAAIRLPGSRPRVAYLRRATIIGRFRLERRAQLSCAASAAGAGTAEIDREGKIIVFVGSLKSEKGQRWSPGIDPLAEMRIHRTEVGRFQSLV
jgi:hypothetical protein